ARVFIGEVDLIGWAHSATRRHRRFAARFLSSARALFLAPFHVRIKVGLLACIPLGAACFDLRLGLPDRRQALFAPRQFLRDAQALGQGLLIGGLGTREQLFYFGFQLRLDLLSMPV